MMEAVSRTEALTVSAFHASLREFVEESYDNGDATVGDTAGRGQKAWVWVKRLGHRYYLNADTKVGGVAEYLALVDQYGDDISWEVVPNRDSVVNKVAFGPDRRVIPSLYFYRA